MNRTKKEKHQLLFNFLLSVAVIVSAIMDVQAEVVEGFSGLKPGNISKYLYTKSSTWYAGSVHQTNKEYLITFETVSMRSAGDTTIYSVIVKDHYIYYHFSAYHNHDSISYPDTVYILNVDYKFISGRHVETAISPEETSSGFSPDDFVKIDAFDLADSASLMKIEKIVSLEGSDSVWSISDGLEGYREYTAVQGAGIIYLNYGMPIYGAGRTTTRTFLTLITHNDIIYNSDYYNQYILKISPVIKKPFRKNADKTSHSGCQFTLSGRLIKNKFGISAKKGIGNPVIVNDKIMIYY